MRAEDGTDRDGLINVLDCMSQSILDENSRMWKREQEYEKLGSRAKGSTHTRNTDDSSSAGPEDEKKEVAEGPPPPPEKQYVGVEAKDYQ